MTENKEEILKKINAHVKEKFLTESTGHDWWHIHRVRNLALSIGREEKADLYIVELDALLHDIADFKFHNGDESVGPHVAAELLQSFGATEDTKDAVVHII